MEIDADSKDPIGDQIAAQIRGHLVSGRLRTGDRLSSPGIWPARCGSRSTLCCVDTRPWPPRA
ncbi:hypothetical protein [Streptomyces sp. NPDC059455]|uniref:hypothetical protein n=1 Tax=Streptomyces sp. NPDC059455 TaxID=3346837 RepID=UPI0036BF5746